MEVRRRQKYVTARQKEKLIEFMTKHPELISCKVRQGFTHKDSQRLWQVIANECNSIHLGARKSWRQWKKTWQDMRSKTKKRQAQTNGEIVVSRARLINTEQVALQIKEIEPSELQETTEFITLENNSQEMFNEDLSGSLSDRDSPMESKSKIRAVRRRQKYVTPRQKQKLINLMKKHPELNSAKHKHGMSSKDLQILWQGIANECNSIHLGARKSWSQWKKTWQDMRSKMIKRQTRTNGDLVPAKPTNTEQEALALQDIESSEYQESTEFITMEENSQEVFNEELSGSLSERDSPVEAKVFNSSTVKNTQLNSGKPSTKHKCYLNCDLLAVQEQRKIQIKEDYLNFKKDYLRQKLTLLKEQTEALKSIAKELST